MPAIHCDEATIYASVALLCGVVALLAMARAFLYTLGALICHVVGDRRLPPLLEHSMCAAVLVTAVVLFGDVSALMPWVVLLATVTSGAFCWSLRSLRWIGVSSFVFYSLVVMHLVGPALVEEVDLSRQEWSALVQGQRMLILSLPPLPSLSIYSYYDKVTIEGSSSPLATSTASAALPRLLLELSVWWTNSVKWVSECNESMKKRRRRDHITQGAEPPFSTYLLVASGDNTQLSHYTRDVRTTTPVMAGSDRIHLVGRRNAIRHSHVYCIIPDSRTDPTPPPAATIPTFVDVRCLQLRDGTLLRNVTIHWAVYPSSSLAPSTTAEAGHTLDSLSSAQYAWRSLHVGADSEQSCADVQAQLQGELGVAVSSSLIECVDEVDVAKLPLSFVTKAPLFVWLGWQFPGYVHRVQDMLLFFCSHVASPMWALVVVTCHVSWEATLALAQQCGVWLVEMAPYVKRGAEHVAIFLGGALCSSSTRREESIDADGDRVDAREALLRALATPSSRCATFARAHAAHSAFRAGAQTRTSVVAIVSAAMDTLDLVPGVWSVYTWSWKAEYRITLWIVAALQQAFFCAFSVILQPVARVLIIAAQYLAALVPKIVIALHYLWRWISQLRILAYFSPFCTFMWALEKRVWRYEWSTLKVVLAFLAAQGERVVYVCARYAAVGGGYATSLVHHYSTTSLSTHMAVVFLQTALLGIAMRNELNQFVVAEQQQRTPARSFLARCIPASMATWLPPNVLANRVNGLWMLVRAYLVECVRYFLLHAVATLVLIGLSVLPFASKLYALSLRYVFPWLSGQYFLTFFSHDRPPIRRVAVYFVGRMVVATVLQDTIGDLIYSVLKDLLRAVGLTGGLALLLFAWPQRASLAKQVATAITDSLQATPTQTRVSMKPVAESNATELKAAEKVAEDKENEEARQRDVSVVKQINLVDAT
ncbi:hypothetical protein Q4I30_007377 [Leishmania utingensis]|uniref:Transmembrane protein n=1 Tax=Leishmania utingensis TaxID=653362 RepID=A0AAW2ZW54_9TRYP